MWACGWRAPWRSSGSIWITSRMPTRSEAASSCCSHPVGGLWHQFGAAGGTGLAVVPGSSRGGGNLPAAAKVAIGAALLQALRSTEVRLHFGLRLDTIITVVAIWRCWRWRWRCAGSCDHDLGAQVGKKRECPNRTSPYRLVCGRLPIPRVVWPAERTNGRSDLLGPRAARLMVSPAVEHVNSVRRRRRS